MKDNELRVCKKCGLEKPLTSFGETVSQGNGRKYRRNVCYVCKNEANAKWRENNRERLREIGRRATQRMRERQAEKMGYEAFRKLEAGKTKAYNASLKAQVYAAYGGYKCACCGETEPSFLSIDHMNNDGYKLRKAQTQGSGVRILGWLKKHGYPEGYQILCMNCQHGKARNGGVCPHQKV